MICTVRQIENKFLAFICVLVIFFCRYEVWFSFMPLTMLRLMQFIGVAYIFLLIVSGKFSVPKKLAGIIVFCLLFAIYALFSSLWAGQGLAMFRIMINLLLFLGISLWVLRRIEKVETVLSPGRLLDYWIYVAIFQVVISFLFFINHGIYEEVTSMLNLSEGMIKRNDLINVRVIGLGNAFFGAGFNYAVDLFVLALMPYVPGSKIYARRWFYWILVVVILTIGILSARTFLIGVFCVLLFILYNERKHLLRLFGGSVKIFLILGVAVPLIYFILKKYVENLELIVNWAFEMFINFSSGEGLETSSTSKMFEMYVFPDSGGTWWLGDGKMENPDGSYYMYTDIGFIRLIFFWGLPATLLFYIYRFYCIRVIYENSLLLVLKPFMLCYLLFEYLCQMKGLVFGDFFISFFMAYVFWIEKKYFSLAGKMKINT